MQLRLLRILGAAVAAEAAGIAALVAWVAVFGPRDAAAASVYANEVGQWLGPISGFCLCLLLAWWVARGAPPTAPVANGLAVGVCAAAIDLGVVVLSATPLAWIFIASNVGRLLAGALGGWLAARNRPRSG